MNNPNTWAELAAATNPADIKQRTQFYKDKKTGEEKSFKVSYIDARTVIERLNSVCPGEWHFQVKELKPPTKEYTKWVCTGTLTVCGIVQEDVGINDNEDAFDPPKSAVSDCLKRCGVHFGIGIDLYPGHGSDEGYSKPKPAQAQRSAPSATETAQGGQPQAETPTDAENAPYTPEQIVAKMPPMTKALSEMDGKELFLVQTWGPLYMKAARTMAKPATKHFENRWKTRFGVKMIREIGYSLADFLAMMADDYGQPEAHTAAETYVEERADHD